MSLRFRLRGAVAIVFAVLAPVGCSQGNERQSAAQQPMPALAPASQREVRAAVAPAPNPKPTTAVTQRRATSPIPLVPQLGHPGAVDAVAFSPDGRQLLTGSTSGALLWDVATGLQIRRFSSGPDGGIVAVAFSPDGSLLATCNASGNGGLSVWDRSSGKLRWQFAPDFMAFGQFPWIHAVAFSPDGKLLASAGQEPFARLFEVANGREVRRFDVPSGQVEALAFSPVGSQLLIASAGTVRSWDVATAKLQGTFGDDDTESVKSLTFSADGKLVLGCWLTSLRMWDPETGTEVRRLRMPEFAYFHRATLSRDARLVAAAIEGPPGKAVVWDAATGKERYRLSHPSAGFTEPAGVHDVVFSPDGKQLLTGCVDHTASFWDVATGKELRRIEGRFQWTSGVAITPDGERVLTNGGDGFARLWDVASGKEFQRFRGQSDLGAGHAKSACISADGRHVLTSGVGLAQLWDVQSGKELSRFVCSQPFTPAIAFSPSGKYMLVGGQGKPLMAYDVETKQHVQTFLTENAPMVQFVTVSADDTTVFLTNFGGPNDRLWDFRTGKQLRTLIQNPPLFHCAAFSPNGELVVTGGFDRTARLWNVATGREIRASKEFELPVSTVAFWPDGSKILIGVSGHEAVVWDVATGKQLQSFAGSKTTYDRAVAQLLGGKKVLVGSWEHGAKIWDVETGREAGTMFVAANGIVIVTPDNYYHASRVALSGIAFQIGDRALPFEQFDLKLNRPDIVLARLGLASANLIAAYHRAYEKRLHRMNLTEEMLSNDAELPEVSIAADDRYSAQDKSLTIHAKASTKTGFLDRLNVQVNGVPVNGDAGLSLRDRHTKSCDQEVTIKLSDGENHIQVSALDDQGLESLASPLEINCLAPPVKPDLYLIAIGVSTYKDHRLNLQYADKDARDLAAMWESRKGASFRNVRVETVLNEKATRENILRYKELLAQSNVDDEVVLFFAGHGLLDAKFDYYFGTADVDFRDPSARGLSYEAIEGLMDGIPARKKLLLMDTCHSGEVDHDDTVASVSTRAVGGAVHARGFRGLELDRSSLGLENSRDLLQELFADLRRGTGTAVIAAAGGMEMSLESGDWKNGVFTYAILRGLKTGQADFNEDHRITVSELRDFVMEEVERLTSGRQAPTARRENLAFDFQAY